MPKTNSLMIKLTSKENWNDRRIVVSSIICDKNVKVNLFFVERKQILFKGVSIGFCTLR